VLEEAMNWIVVISESNKILPVLDGNLFKIVQEVVFVKLFVVCLHTKKFRECVTFVCLIQAHHYAPTALIPGPRSPSAHHSVREDGGLV
jgi:hypothetical protein